MRVKTMAATSFGTRSATESAAGRGKPSSLRTEAVPSEQAVGRLMALMRAEYVEMPGLSVTPAQARRLWAVDRATCDEAFSRLIAAGLVRTTARGTLVRA